MCPVRLWWVGHRTHPRLPINAEQLLKKKVNKIRHIIIFYNETKSNTFSDDKAQLIPRYNYFKIQILWLIGLFVVMVPSSGAALWVGLTNYVPMAKSVVVCIQETCIRRHN